MQFVIVGHCDTFNNMHVFLMMLQVSIVCVDNADGCPGVVVYGNETFPLLFQQVMIIIYFVDIQFKLSNF